MSVLIINDNEEDITCRLCGEQCKRIYGRHLKHSHNNISTKEYKKLFPGAPITTLSDRKNTSKNSGLHMKTEKYKKIFSKKIMGDKNPMHRSNTTEQFRKEQSPFSKEFYKKRYPNLTEKEIDNKISDFATEATKNRILPSNKEYWINKGYSEKESIKKVSNHQTTFSKEICIEKYGEEKGIKIWSERQEKWISSLNKGGKLKNGYSEISQFLFNEIEKRIGMDNDFMYGSKNLEFKLKGNTTHRWYMYDFTNILNKKIIEYNGDNYHANPFKFNENDTPHPFRKNLTSKDIWEHDEIKNKVAIDKGFDILIIWENEYNKKNGYEKNEIALQKCIDFLKN